MTVYSDNKYHVILDRWSGKRRPLASITLLETNDKDEADAYVAEYRAERKGRPQYKGSPTSAIKIKQFPLRQQFRKTS